MGITNDSGESFLLLGDFIGSPSQDIFMNRRETDMYTTMLTTGCIICTLKANYLAPLWLEAARSFDLRIGRLQTRFAPCLWDLSLGLDGVAFRYLYGSNLNSH